MVAVAGDDVAAEVWIGVDDHLPRLVRVVYANEPAHAHYQTEFSNWKLNEPVPPDAFTSEKSPPRPHISTSRRPATSGPRRRSSEPLHHPNRRGEEMRTLVFAASAALVVALPFGEADAWYSRRVWRHCRRRRLSFQRPRRLPSTAHMRGRAASTTAQTYGGFYHGTYANGSGVYHTGALWQLLSSAGRGERMTARLR